MSLNPRQFDALGNNWIPEWGARQNRKSELRSTIAQKQSVRQAVKASVEYPPNHTEAVTRTLGGGYDRNGNVDMGNLTVGGGGSAAARARAGDRGRHQEPGEGREHPRPVQQRHRLLRVVPDGFEPGVTVRGRNAPAGQRLEASQLGRVQHPGRQGIRLGQQARREPPLHGGWPDVLLPLHELTPSSTKAPRTLRRGAFALFRLRGAVASGGRAGPGGSSRLCRPR